MKKQRISPPAVGGTSLLVIFAVLCLTMFALLSLSTVLAEKRLADAAAEAMAAEYEADFRAQQIFARLRAGEPVPEAEREDDVYFFVCPVSENRRLEVQVLQRGSEWTVLRWQTVSDAPEEKETLPVWDGS